MFWLLVTLLSYLILAIVFLIDKYLLMGPIPNPKVYAFYSGILGVLILLIIPFVGFYIPQPSQIILSFLAGIFFIYGLFWFYKALQLFEPSRIVPLVGGILPLFTAGLVYATSRGKEILSQFDFLAFVLLILGSFLITYEKSKKISFKSFQISIITALLFAFYFVLAKYIYIAQPFWSGYIWIRIGAFLTALCFLLFSTDVKEEILKKKKIIPRSSGLFLFNQGLGAGANILQNWAVALAPLVYVVMINALQGTQYVFLLIFIVFLSLTRPLWAKRAGLKEEISREVIFQKVIAILLIGGGLAILALK